MRALHEVGTALPEEALREAALVALKNLTVEPRYAQTGYRDWQNYVGESMLGCAPVVHYI